LEQKRGIGLRSFLRLSCLNLYLLRLDLRKAQLENTVFVSGIEVIGIDLFGNSEAPLERTVVSLNSVVILVFILVFFFLAGKRKETSKHSGAISLFDSEFVKPGIFSKDLSRWLHGAFDLRQRTDYATQMQVSKEESVLILKEANDFICPLSFDPCSSFQLCLPRESAK